MIIPWIHNDVILIAFLKLNLELQELYEPVAVTSYVTNYISTFNQQHELNEITNPIMRIWLYRNIVR